MKKTLKMIGNIAFFYLMPIIVIILVQMLFSKVSALGALTKEASTAFFIVSDPIIVALYFVFVKFTKKQNLFKYVNFSSMPLSKILICFGFGAALGIFTYSLANVAFINEKFPSFQGSFKYFIIQGNLFLLMMATIINSAFKEIGFRGLIFKELLNGVSAPVAVIIVLQAAFYGLWVFYSTRDVFMATYGWLGCVMFGVAYYLMKSMWSSILVQIGCTFSMILIDRTALVGVFSSQNAIFTCALGVILIIVLLVAMTKAAGKQTASVTKSIAK